MKYFHMYINMHVEQMSVYILTCLQYYRKIYENPFLPDKLVPNTLHTLMPRLTSEMSQHITAATDYTHSGAAAASLDNASS